MYGAEYIPPLLIASLIGALMGIERAIANKGAGMRTYALVSMGSCLFTITGRAVTESILAGQFSFDPTRILASIVTGIGFIGAGLFIFRENKVHNITTAAGLWVAAGIGVAVAYRLYLLALFAALLTLCIFTFLWYIQKSITRLSDRLLD